MRSLQFVTAVIERANYDDPSWNVVLFSETPKILSLQEELMDAADIVQSRYQTDRFLIEASPETTESDVEAVADAFRFDGVLPLYCVPFARRGRLDDATFFACDFVTYTLMWNAIVGDGAEADPVDLESFWEELYDTESFALFRLILQK